MKQILLTLGRYGDVVNALPIARYEAKRGNRMGFCVASQFASILEGVSYVDPIVWPGDYSTPALALAWLAKTYPESKVVLAQAYRSPVDKRRLTPSYQMEAYRLAGRQDEFAMWPTVFDQRSSDRERQLMWQVRMGSGPYILVGLDSVSSPLKKKQEILLAIRKAFGTFQVIDLSEVRATRLYDVLGLMDNASCLVTADTVWLHLARASRVPVVALISEGNVGQPVAWFGSVPPPTTVHSSRYSQTTSDCVVHDVQEVVSPLWEEGQTIHVVDDHGDTSRHAKARQTWKAEYSRAATDWTPSVDGKPRLREVLTRGIQGGRFADVVVWSNSDTVFTEGAFDKIKAHVQQWGACSIRRKETDGRLGVHMGRDVVAFRVDWLQGHLDQIPDFVLGAPCFDLVLAAIIRKARGIPSCIENLHDDIFPCEMDAGLILHEPHESSWLAGGPAVDFNKKLAKEWCQAQMPTLRL